MSLLVDISPILETHRKRKCGDSDKSHKITRSFQHSNAKLSGIFAPLYDDILPEQSRELARMDVSPQAITNIDRNYLPPKLRKGVKMTRNFPSNCGEDCAIFSNVEAVLPEWSEELTRMDVSPQGITKMDRKYPPPKIRKNVTMTRNFPPNCGKDCATFSNVSMENGKENSKTKPCKVKEESNDILFESWKQLRSLSDGNVVKDENESARVTGTPSKNFQDFYCEEDWRRKDREISTIITQRGEVVKAQWQLGNENHNKSNARVDEMMGNYDEDEDEDYSMDVSWVHNHDENEPKDLSIVPYDENGPKDLCIVPYDAAGEPIVARKNQVQEALKLFEKLYDKLHREYKAESKGGRVKKQIHIEAAIKLKNDQKWVNMKPKIGHVPGVEVGDSFQFRAQLALVGLHHELMCGINCMTINGEKHANSVVDAGRYHNKVLSRDVIVYSGQGGNSKTLSQDKLEDQKLEGANLALKRSMDANLPVRVIRKIGRGNHNNNNNNNSKMYIYDGLYLVRNFWQEKQIPTKKLAFMFEMVRVSGQPETSSGYFEQNNGARASDLSQGKEKIPIRFVNDLNDEKPQTFTYITEMKYPPGWYRISEPNGCDCTDGCSDYEPCCCADKNGGEIPFNEQGSIIQAKCLVHECGPLCKCPLSCQNRVSQRGPRFQLEVFKTKSTGWGVRSREEIPSGSFICEYIGELLHDKEAEERSNDEYLFDLDDCDGFTIDAAEYGNVGRFINHSCSPNLYAQNVLYDNDDQRLPHIMLFATKKIPAFQELSYDYNYKVDRVCDSKGKIKKKICNCGSRKCSGRMY